MLKRVYRLRSVALKKPSSITTPYFSLKTSNNKFDINRFAFVVSKKIDKRAVVRNRIRRKVRASVEEIFDRIDTGHDFVFYPKRKARDAEQSQILNELEEALQKRGFIK